MIEMLLSSLKYARPGYNSNVINEIISIINFFKAQVILDFVSTAVAQSFPSDF